MYPHKNFLLVIYLCCINFYTIDANNIKNNYLDLSFKATSTKTIYDFCNTKINFKSSPIKENKTQTNFCGAEAYNSTITYKNTGVLVIYNCKIWRNIGYANPGVKPGGNNSWAWEFVSFCDEGDCSPNIYCDVYEFDNEIKYKANTKVFYNCKIWNKISNNGEAGVEPVANNSWAWEFVSFCDESDCAPNIYCDVYEYSSDIKYKINDKVYYNCMIWINIHGNANPGVSPGGTNNWAWKFDSYCDGGECEFYDGVLEFDETMIYEAGIKVYYNGMIWESKWVTNAGQTPNNNSGNPWEIIEEKSLSVEDDLLKENIQLYYNNYKIYYDFSKLQNTSQIICYDLKGSVIFSKEVTNSKDQINLPSIQQGLYFLQIFNNNARTYKKIIVF